MLPCNPRNSCNTCSLTSGWVGGDVKPYVTFPYISVSLETHHTWHPMWSIMWQGLLFLVTAIDDVSRNRGQYIRIVFLPVAVLRYCHIGGSTFTDLTWPSVTYIYRMWWGVNVCLWLVLWTHEVKVQMRIDEHAESCVVTHARFGLSITQTATSTGIAHPAFRKLL